MSKPWINGRIKKMMKIRDHILKKLKKDNSAKNHHLYKKFRNRVASELKKSKVTYFHNYCTINSQNMKKLWSCIKIIVSHKNSSSSTINEIKDNDDLKVLRLSEIFELRLLTFVYESVNKISPVCFHNFFTFNASVHQHQTRQACRGDLYLTQKKSLQHGLKSIKYLGHTVCNKGKVCKEAPISRESIQSRFQRRRKQLKYKNVVKEVRQKQQEGATYAAGDF